MEEGGRLDGRERVTLHQRVPAKRKRTSLKGFLIHISVITMSHPDYVGKKEETCLQGCCFQGFQTV
jgi:hypothetical protein